MITEKTEKHQLEIGDEKGVVDLLTNAFSNPEFVGFNAYKSYKLWPSGTMNPKKVFNVSIDFRCNQL
jgi:hypothetical protein